MAEDEAERRNDAGDVHLFEQKGHQLKAKIVPEWSRARGSGRVQVF